MRSETDRALSGACRRSVSTTFCNGRENETLVDRVRHAGQLVPPFCTTSIHPSAHRRIHVSAWQRNTRSQRECQDRRPTTESQGRNAPRRFPASRMKPKQLTDLDPERNAAAHTAPQPQLQHDHPIVRNKPKTCAHTFRRRNAGRDSRPPAGTR